MQSLYDVYATIESGINYANTTCSFCHDVWFQDESLEDLCPALYSHCNDKDCTVAEMFNNGLPNSLVPRLTARATTELHFVQQLLGGCQPGQLDRQETLGFQQGRVWP